MDTFALIAAERRRLADVLDELEPAEWERPSLCEGWSAHVVAAHLNAPWAVSGPAFAVAAVRSRGNLDRAMDRISRDAAARLDPAACVAGLRANADNRFTPPTVGPEAPLTDVLVHGADILQPMGRTAGAGPQALAVALGWLAAGGRRGFVSRSQVQDLTFEATDLDQRFGTGPEVVEGPALALCGALVGRPAHLPELSGDGAAVLAARL